MAQSWLCGGGDVSPHRGRYATGRCAYTPNKVANFLVEFSTSIPRTQLRPRYGEGFLGAPLQVGTRREQPTPAGQGDDGGPSSTPADPITGDS
jgi:hypothetical protein